MKSRRLVIASICIILLSVSLITLLTAGRRAADPIPPTHSGSSGGADRRRGRGVRSE